MAENSFTPLCGERPTKTYHYPYSSAPDIIRACQKDAYFQGILLEQFSHIIRNIRGSRFLHNYTTEARIVSDLLYFSLTTLVGNRTLGEEYCDIIQVEERTLWLPSPRLRAGYILTAFLLPYVLNRILPSVRGRARSHLEMYLKRRPKTVPTIATLLRFLLNNLDALTSPSSIYAISLAVFYFSGEYYHLSKRVWGLRYIFTRKLTPSDRRVGYELLGVLLVLQIAVQGYISLHDTVISNVGTPVLANAGSAAGGSAIIEGGVEVSLDPNAYSSNNSLLLESDVAPFEGPASQAKVSRITHTTVEDHGKHRYTLSNKVTMKWLAGRQARKCTLCLEPMKDPSVTTCGHTFCWTCICDWVQEKPECPLCRQACLPQHILPLRG